MMSQVYRQSIHHQDIESLRSTDPNNDLLAYFPTRRLMAEEIRDAMFRITGELNPAVGGLPVMPAINMEVALQPRMIQFSLAPAYQPSPTPEARNRRSIYAYRVRGQADQEEPIRKKHFNNHQSTYSRRNFLYGLGATLGSVAFSSIFQSQEKAPPSSLDPPPLTPKAPMIPARAKT